VEDGASGWAFLVLSDANLEGREVELEDAVALRDAGSGL
jgi:hypothetical protein